MIPIDPIDGHEYSSGRCLIIGEIAQAHDGSLGTAHAYIDAIARAGAHAIKFQTHIAAVESSRDEPWRVKFSPQDDTRYEYWQRMEFTEPQWHGLKKHCDQAGLHFLSSPFSIEAVELLDRVDVAAWKIASGEVSNPVLLAAVTEIGRPRPVLISTGMSPLGEIDAAVHQIRRADLPVAVMQCTTAYPCPPEKVGVNMIGVFRERYGCDVGLSDHSGTIYPSLAAATLGASILEVHVIFSRETFGPDVAASVTTAELAQLVSGVRFIEKMRSVQIDKDLVAKEMAPLRDAFTKSVVARVDIAAGTVLAADHLTVRKPGTGIPAAELSGLLGCLLREDIGAGEMLARKHVEGRRVES